MSSSMSNSNSQNSTISDFTSSADGTSATKLPYWTSERVAIYALLGALAIALSFISIPIFPAAPYLKYDPSGVVILLAGFAYGPLAALILSVVSVLPSFFMGNPIGGFIALMCILAFSLPSSVIYTKMRTRKGAFISMIVGAAAFIAMAIILNLLLTPLYSKVSVEAVAAMIVPILLPFNLLKSAIHLALTTVCYKPVTALLKAFSNSRKNDRRI